MIRRTFVLSAAVRVSGASLARAADTVGGRFIAQHKDAKLAFVSAYDAGKDNIVIVATEKDHSASKTPARDAEFSMFGSAVTISLAKPVARSPKFSGHAASRKVRLPLPEASRASTSSSR